MCDSVVFRLEGSDEFTRSWMQGCLMTLPIFALQVRRQPIKSSEGPRYVLDLDEQAGQVVLAPNEDQRLAKNTA